MNRLNWLFRCKVRVLQNRKLERFYKRVSEENERRMGC